MPIDLVNTYLALPLFALVASRIGGIVLFLPMIGGLAIPARIRAALVIGLAALITPMVKPDHAAPTELLTLGAAIAGELAIGVLMGLTVRVCFDAVQAGAQLIAQETGLAFSQIVDPTSGHEVDTLSVFYVQLAGVVFLVVGGHRVLIAAALDSFASVPPLGAAAPLAGSLDGLLEALAAGAELALKVAAPVLITMLLVNVALGFVSRTVPQLNVATVGFSIKGLLAFVLVAASLPLAMEGFVDTLEQVVGGMTNG